MKKGQFVISSLIAAVILGTTCLPTYAYTKDETVYTKLNPDGSTQTTVVSEHLKNNGKEQSLKDLSDLSDIFNVNGDEKFTQDGHQLVWESQGNDIYYQGKTDKDLPISMKIDYQFNGKSMKVDDMLGKKGKIKIHIQFINHEKKNGLYVPFVVTTGTMLPTDKNSQVEVTNGKVVSNGSNNVVIALASPGLYENFGKKKELKDFDEVTIQYETKSFELKSIMTMVTPTVLDEGDIDIFDKMDDGYTMVDKLSSAYSQLKSGSKELSSGAKTFASRYNQFNDGVNTLNSQSQLLVDGSKKVNTGVGQLDKGLGQLQTGLNQLSGNSEQLRTGTHQLVQQIIATVNQQLKQSGLSVTVNEDNYNTVLTQQINGFKTQKSQLEAQLQQIKNNGGTQEQITQIETGIKATETAIYSLQGTKTTLDSVLSYKQGVQTYTKGVDQATSSMKTIKKGSSQLLQGSKDLVSGTKSLIAGTSQLAENSVLLNQAATTLSNGANKLSAGINQFGQEGIQKIVDLVKVDLKQNADKAKKLENLAKDYRTFTETQDNVKCSTKFVMIVNGKKK